MLKEILDAERVKRETEARAKAAVKTELDSIVAGIHAEWAKHWPLLATLRLKDGYRRTHPMPSDYGTKLYGQTFPGLTMRVWDAMEMELRMTVNARTETQGPQVTLYYGRPYQTAQVLWKEDAFTPPEELVRRFLLALVPFLDLGTDGGKP